MLIRTWHASATALTAFDERDTALLASIELGEAWSDAYSALAQCCRKKIGRSGEEAFRQLPGIHPIWKTSCVHAHRWEMSGSVIAKRSTYVREIVQEVQIM